MNELKKRNNFLQGLVVHRTCVCSVHQENRNNWIPSKMQNDMIIILRDPHSQSECIPIVKCITNDHDIVFFFTPLNCCNSSNLPIYDKYAWYTYNCLVNVTCNDWYRYTTMRKRKMESNRNRSNAFKVLHYYYYSFVSFDWFYILRVKNIILWFDFFFFFFFFSRNRTRSPYDYIIESIAVVQRIIFVLSFSDRVEMSVQNVLIFFLLEWARHGTAWYIG